MDKELKAQIKYTLIECIEESLNLIKKSSKEILKIKDKNEITGDNPVTQIDLDSQNLIINNINKKFPNHEILGEEGKEEKIVKSDFLWIIDPIDGTKNFINQIPFFCVSIAIVYKGEIIGGAVGLPWEKNSIIYAMKNEGISSNFSQKNYQDLKKYPVAGILSFAPTYFNLSYIVKNQFYKITIILYYNSQNIKNNFIVLGVSTLHSIF